MGKDRDRESPQKTGADSHISAFQELFNETRQLFHRLKYVAGQVHGGGEMTAARRGVLLSLYRNGQQTVPQMARARPVTRQHIQSIVNTLLADELVELKHNPAHKRSRLVSLTKAGAVATESMIEREAGLLKGLTGEVGERDLVSATAVLRSVRELFESERWQRAIKAEVIAQQSEKTRK